MRAEFIGAGGNPHGTLGWVARTSLEANSKQVSATIQKDGLAVLQYRRSIAGPIEEARAELAGADVLQLERKDNSYSMSAARFGEPFTSVQAGEIDLDDEIL